MISGKKSYRLNSGKKILARKYTWRKKKLPTLKKYIFNGEQCWEKNLICQGKKLNQHITRVILPHNPNH